MSSISIGWIFWSVNDTSVVWNPELNVFKGLKFVGTISNKLQNGLLEQIYIKLLNLVDNHYWQCYNQLTLVL